LDGGWEKHFHIGSVDTARWARIVPLARIMTDEALESRLKLLVANERKVTAEILGLIQLGETRKLHLRRSYSSSYEWLIKGFGYSHSSAYRRIQASRLSARITSCAAKIESGRLSLSVAAEIQNCVSKEERNTKKKIPDHKLEQIITKLEGKSDDQARALLGKIFVHAGGPRDSLRAINEEASRLNIVISASARKSLERSRDVLAHRLPGARWSAILEFLSESFLDANDALRRETQRVADSATPRSITPKLRAKILQRASGRCEFVDPATSRRCECRYQLEVDHIHPRALGGTNALTNLRALCRPHNLYEAERILGPR
jgi:hypothetical protein